MKKSPIQILIVILFLACGCTTTENSRPWQSYEADESGHIYVVSEVDIKPVILKKGKLDMKGSRLAHAKAQVAVLVGEYGQIISTEIAYAKSDEFAKAALDAARKCEFEPAIKDDKLVKCLIILPVSYIAPSSKIPSSVGALSDYNTH